jgi:hypothetical protein
MARLYDARDGAIVQEFSGHNDIVLTLSVLYPVGAPAAATAVSAGDATRGRKSKSNPTPLIAAAEEVAAAAAAAAGAGAEAAAAHDDSTSVVPLRLLTGSDDGTAKVFNVDVSGVEKHKLKPGEMHKVTPVGAART